VIASLDCALEGDFFGRKMELTTPFFLIPARQLISPALVHRYTLLHRDAKTSSASVGKGRQATA
jgi:hypothetical protein